jgi:hypothetical protein
MIGHRDGHVVSLCDGCFRPRRTGELGWEHTDEGGLPESRATDATDPHGNVRVGVSPEGPLDWCPDCVAERTVRA